MELNSIRSVRLEKKLIKLSYFSQVTINRPLNDVVTDVIGHDLHLGKSYRKGKAWFFFKVVSIFNVVLKCQKICRRIVIYVFLILTIKFSCVDFERNTIAMTKKSKCFNVIKH